MDVRPWPSRAAAQDLSKAERFALAGLTVDPPTRRIIAGDREELVEPRVMRVLVALDLARGKVLSRDDLIELCWDGLIVGDNVQSFPWNGRRHYGTDSSRLRHDD